MFGYIIPDKPELKIKEFELLGPITAAYARL